MAPNPTEKEQLVLKAALANGISSRKELANFMAQVSHESNGFRIEEENLNYSAKRLAQVWPKRYAGQNGTPNQKALNIANNPEKIANETYSNRMSNGNEATGDGYRYRATGGAALFN